MLEFSKHAEDKLKLYETPKESVLKALKNPKYICTDTVRQSIIYILALNGGLFSVVIRENTIITVYKTDERKLNSRIRSGRWSCRNCY